MPRDSSMNRPRLRTTLCTPLRLHGSKNALEMTSSPNCLRKWLLKSFLPLPRRLGRRPRLLTATASRRKCGKALATPLLHANVPNFRPLGKESPLSTLLGQPVRQLLRSFLAAESSFGVEDAWFRRRSSRKNVGRRKNLNLGQPVGECAVCSSSFCPGKRRYDVTYYVEKRFANLEIKIKPRLGKI